MRRNLWLSALALALSVFAAAGCEDDTPVDRCNRLFETLCRKKTTCDRTTDYATCRLEYGPRIDCTIVCETTDSYGACLSAIQADNCTNLMHPTTYDFPTVCEGALLTGPGCE